MTIYIYVCSAKSNKFLFFFTGLSLGCLTFSMALRLSVRVAWFLEAGARCVMVALLSLLA